MSDESKQDYEVGYGKPPRHTQFQPGQSGNPKGRPKKTKDLQKLIDKELSRNVRITEDGEVKTLTARELLIKTIVNAAVKGDRHARQLLFAHMKEQPDMDGLEIDAAAEAMLEAFIEGRAASRQGDGHESKN